MILKELYRKQVRFFSLSFVVGFFFLGVAVWAARKDFLYTLAAVGNEEVTLFAVTIAMLAGEVVGRPADALRREFN